MPQGYKRLINKEKERKDVIQIIDDEGFLREVSFDDLTSHPNTLAGYGITDAYISNGTIYLGNQSITPAAISSLGTAAYKNYTASVTQGGTDLPTSDAVFQAIGAAVSSALHYRGISSTIITDGGTETAVIGGQPLIVQSGDVVIYSGFEFLWENNVWNKLGDDTSFALKTVQITGDGIYIIGGGDLTISRSLGLSQAAIDALTLASTALQSVAFSDLTSHPTTLSGYGITDANISNGIITLGNNTITPLTSFTETDPTVSAWAKAASKPTYTLDEVSDGSTRKLDNYVLKSGVTVPSTVPVGAWNTEATIGTVDSKNFKIKFPAKPSYAFSDLVSHPTTLSGYGITDAKIANGTITLGGNSITPLTSFIETDPTVPSWAKQSTKPSYGLNEINGTDDLKAIEALSGTGLAKRTADNTWELTDTADKAEELVTSTEEDAMFTSRQVPSVAVGDVCKITSVKGKSIVWNQLVQNGDFSDGVTGWEEYGSVTFSVSDGFLTVVKTRNSYGYARCPVSLIAGHYYYYAAYLSSEYSYSVGIGFADADNPTANIGRIAIEGGSSAYISGIHHATGVEDYIILRSTNGAVAGSSFTAKNVICIDLTLMFGAGNEPATVEEFEALYPLPYYAYNHGELVNNAASGVEMLDAGSNSLGTIPLNITGLTSGGVQIFPDGMKSAGSVADEWSGSTATKRIGVVDLGTLNWHISGGVFYTTDLSAVIKKKTSTFLCDKYTTNNDNVIISSMPDKSVGSSSGSAGVLWIKDSAYTDAATFKAAMSGVLLYYELKEPETYTVDALPDNLVPFDAQGTQRRLPVDTSEEVAAPMVCDFQYGANIGDVIKSINNNTEEYRKKSDNNFTNIETDEIHCTGDIEANGNLTINDVIAAAINAQGEMSIPTQMPSTIELGRVFMYYDEAVHQLCIRESVS